MSIDRAQVQRIAELAHLEFDEEALAKTALELSKILDYIDQLAGVDLTAHDFQEAPAETPFREDQVQPSMPVEATERNAPAFAHGHFVVPKIVGGEP